MEIFWRKSTAVLAVICLAFGLLWGCSFANPDEAETGRFSSEAAETEEREEKETETTAAETGEGDTARQIPFGEDQLYAVAYLGYQEMGDLSYYQEHYLNGENLPVHYISDGDFYLVVPRYGDMTMRLYWSDIETSERFLIYEDGESRPFIIQCNVSDIFPDVTVSLSDGTETVEFSPFISLMDGSVQAGERGIDITHTPQ